MGRVQPVVPRGQPHLPTRNKTMGNPAKTTGRNSHHYEGHKSDALQGSWWGTEEYFYVPDCIRFATWNYVRQVCRSSRNIA